MTPLEAFINDHRRGKGDVQTHTWFGNVTRTLTIQQASDVRQMHSLLVADVKKSSRGQRSITEKVTRGKPFRLFADLDFSISDIDEWKETQGHDDDAFPVAIQGKLKEIVSLYRQVVADATKDDSVGMIMSTRLPYKIHLHFPDVVVDTAAATSLARTFATLFKKRHPDLFHESVTDASVYATGLRLLYCDKGSMMKPEKRKAELDHHEKIWGKKTYSDVYYITDVDTWQQDATPRVSDLEKTSVQVAEDMPQTPLPGLLGKGREKGKGKESAAPVKRGARKERIEARDNALATFLADSFGIPSKAIRMDEKTYRAEKAIVPTRCRACPFAEREHNSNQLYFVLAPECAELRCHDDDCTDTRKVPFADLDPTVSAEVTSLFQTEETIATQRTAAVSASLGKVKELHPRMNCSFEPEAVTPSKLGGEGYLVALRDNRWCPVCRREHDSPENCILTLQREQLILCNRNLANPISIPLSQEHMKVIFNVQNVQNLQINLTTGVSNDVGEVRDFGDMLDFPPILDTTQLNQLCYASLTARSYDVAEFLAQLMKGEYVYQNQVWYRFNGRFWRRCPGPDELMTRRVTNIYRTLQHTYNNEKQIKWLNTLIDDLGNMNRRKPYIEDLERYLEEHGMKWPLDGNPYLLGFENGVFDARDATFRGHRADDWLTTLLPYSVPDKPDPVVKDTINQFMMDIMPDEETRAFLWQMLALHLAGENVETVAMIWTGSGGNGKSVLKNLMKDMFGDLHSEIPSAFLTSDSPNPDRPAPHILKLRLARSVFASEPQNQKKINSALIKFLTGNDQIEVRACQSNDIVAFLPRFLVTVLCNAIPLFQGAEDEVRGLWRRLRIITFGMEFVDNPTAPNHRRRNKTLATQVKLWPPHFMRMLMDVYATYLANGRLIHTPAAVENNLTEQREENCPLDSWLADNLISVDDAEQVVHVHRIKGPYERYLKVLGRHQVMPGESILRQKLKTKGFTFASGRKRDKLCACNNAALTIQGVRLADTMPIDFVI